MTNFMNSLKSLVSQQMIANAAKVIDEKESNVSNAVSMIIPGLLAILMKRKNHSPQVENILHEAGNLDIVSEVKNLCEERPTEDQRRIGDDFLQQILGDKAADFTDPIAEQACVSKVGTNRLISMIAPIVAGYLGNKLVADKWSKTQLFEALEKNKSGFHAIIPEGVIKAFNLESVFNAVPANNTDNNMAAKTIISPEPPKPEEPKKKGKGWIFWLLLLLLLLLAFLAWRSCNNKKIDEISNSAVKTEKQAESAITDKASQIANTLEGEAAKLTLPDGSVLNVYKGGIEEKILAFLKSDEYKNATDNDLKKKWFVFNGVNFVFGSATELNPDSHHQLDNIVAILKSNKDAKIKIGGYADKKGSEQTNMNISRERAKTIESLLASKGVGNQIVAVEGYGEEFAKHQIAESDAARAEDRDIALRFVK